MDGFLSPLFLVGLSNGVAGSGGGGSGGGGGSSTLNIDPSFIVTANVKRPRRKNLPRKDPEESVHVTFDFTAYVPVGVIVLNPVVTSVVLAGVDPNPDTMIDGAPLVDGPKAGQLISGGVAGVNYRLQCVVVTSDGQTLVLSAKLPVRES